jgi:predicted nucleotidyltransferase
MTNKNLIQKIVSILVASAHPLKIILFGSGARNAMQQDSDLDLLIIEEAIDNKGKEMVRLRNAIGNVGVGVDVLVYSRNEVEEWGHLPGTALYSALKEGKVVYEKLH